MTWLYTDYAQRDWRREGAHYAARASATETVGAAGYYTWLSSPKLLADVRLWLHAPQRNFGWALVGDEETRRSSKRLSSREALVVEQRPMLTIEYHLPRAWQPGK